MEEKKHCKWYHEEFCTNEDSPCVADYCPVVEYPELCRYLEKPEIEKTDMVFSCRKCGHLLFISTKNRKAEALIKLLECDCPNCGTESVENRVYCGTGNYNEEYGKNE